MIYQPHEYQSEAEQFLHQVPRCMLAMEMGLGKTVVTATAFGQWLDWCYVRKVLVVGPKRVVENVWPNELRKWDHLRRLRYSIITGSAAARWAALRTRADVYLINRENLAWLAKQYIRARKPWPFDCIVLDESGSYKDRGSLRWKAADWAAQYASRLVLLTGTPISNSHVDIWAQIRLLDRGERLLPTITAFRHNFCVEDVGTNKWRIKDDASKRWVESKVKDIVLSMRADDWLDMPQLTVVDVPVQLGAAARAAYTRLFVTMQTALADGAQITAINAGAKAGKLAQMAGGAVYDAEGVAHAVHEDKLEALEELIEGLGGEPAIVSYVYRHELARLQARFPQGRASSEPGALDAWNRGEVPILWLQAGSDGYGLNLQDGGRHLIWYTLPFGKLDDYLQTIARLWRQGQERPVFVHRLMAEDTIDSRAAHLLGRKNADLAAFMAAMLREG